MQGFQSDSKLVAGQKLPMSRYFKKRYFLENPNESWCMLTGSTGKYNPLHTLFLYLYAFPGTWAQAGSYLAYIGILLTQVWSHFFVIAGGSGRIGSGQQFNESGRVRP